MFPCLNKSSDRCLLLKAVRRLATSMRCSASPSFTDENQPNRLEIRLFSLLRRSDFLGFCAVRSNWIFICSPSHTNRSVQRLLADVSFCQNAEDLNLRHRSSLSAMKYLFVFFLVAFAAVVNVLSKEVILRLSSILALPSILNCSRMFSRKRFNN